MSNILGVTGTVTSSSRFLTPIGRSLIIVALLSSVISIGIVHMVAVSDLGKGLLEGLHAKLR